MPREEIDTWATPLVLEVNGRAAGRSCRPWSASAATTSQTGAVVWEGDGLTMNPIPSPVHEDGLVFLMSGFRGNDLRGDPRRRREGQHRRHERGRLVARSRHAVRAVADPRRRRALFPEDQLGHPVGVRREDRQAALPESAARRRARTSSRRRSPPRAASTSPAAKARRS